MVRLAIFSQPVPVAQKTRLVSGGSDESDLSHKSVSLSALNFSHLMLQQSGSPLDTVEPLLTARALDGKILARVTHPSISLTLILSGNHCEKIKFNIISSTNSPLVQGYPWLKIHSPTIDSSIGRIVWWSFFCKASD